MAQLSQQDNTQARQAGTTSPLPGGIGGTRSPARARGGGAGGQARLGRAALGRHLRRRGCAGAPSGRSGTGLPVAAAGLGWAGLGSSAPGKGRERRRGQPRSPGGRMEPEPLRQRRSPEPAASSDTPPPSRRTPRLRYPQSCSAPPPAPTLPAFATPLVPAVPAVVVPAPGFAILTAPSLNSRLYEPAHQLPCGSRICGAEHAWRGRAGVLSAPCGRCRGKPPYPGVQARAAHPELPTGSAQGRRPRLNPPLPAFGCNPPVPARHRLRRDRGAPARRAAPCRRRGIRTASGPRRPCPPGQPPPQPPAAARRAPAAASPAARHAPPPQQTPAASTPPLPGSSPRLPPPRDHLPLTRPPRRLPWSVSRSCRRSMAGRAASSTPQPPSSELLDGAAPPPPATTDVPAFRPQPQAQLRLPFPQLRHLPRPPAVRPPPAMVPTPP
ncbi:proline-rich protein HaeIII subfamily 1-like [Molothrus aeneus]|uniref:proline-rich protein HaeIII subfamily 1-like n=1 Tax=Molothrus aeneus TaxID=84833 RepID=UPI003457494C